jgi:L-alanine-DL-glutamate epimerase-like enolase superfamily enzyme
VQALDEFELAFVEDPVEPSRWRDLLTLSENVRTPIAAGEDVVSSLQYRDILEAVAILRVDPSTCGGIADAISGIELASRNGAAVLPHGFAGLNAQLAGAFGSVVAVEVIPVEIAADGFDRLVELPYTLGDGNVYLDDHPGAGLRLEWDGVIAAASNVWSMD